MIRIMLIDKKLKADSSSETALKSHDYIGTATFCFEE